MLSSPQEWIKLFNNLRLSVATLFDLLEPKSWDLQFFLSRVTPMMTFPKP